MIVVRVRAGSAQVCVQSHERVYSTSVFDRLVLSIGGQAIEEPSVGTLSSQASASLGFVYCTYL